MNLEQGKKLVRLARSAIFSNEEVIEGFEEKRGVFVTLSSYPSGELRGCIGFPEPVKKLREAVAEAARAAAFEDPRFQPISKDEKFTVEVSVLTVPELIETDIIKNVRIGQDGLIIEAGWAKGLLLPQVFPEWKADAKKALEMTCEKAGLPKGEWKKGGVKIYRFQAEIFSEESPEGEVGKKNI
ncbi:MAG: TIGR00296 family protein [Candidatus Woesearchaeota archaeon]